MRFSRVIFAILVPASLAASVPGTASQAKQSLYQESRTTITKDNQVQTVGRKIWIKYPGKVRMEETLGPQSRLTISNGSDLWIVLPALKKGQHRKLTPQEAKAFANQLKVDLDMTAKFLKAGGKKVRQEKVNGVLCDVYQRAKQGQLTQTLWVAANPSHLAQKQEESGVIRAAERVGEPMKTHILKSTTDYLKWTIDQPVADKQFTAPSGIAYQEYKASAPAAAPKR